MGKTGHEGNAGSITVSRARRVFSREAAAGYLFLGALFGLLSLTAPAQTVITIPRPSGYGIKRAKVRAMGLNLGGEASYGNGQLTANLIQIGNPSFAPQTYQFVSVCAGGGTDRTWHDEVPSSPHPANFWAGATYQVISGVDAGQRGTVLSSTAATGSAGQVFFLSGRLRAPCAGRGATGGDMAFFRQLDPTPSWTGYLTPDTSSELGLSMSYSAGGSSRFETTDLSPDTKQTQALELFAPGNATATMTIAFDGNYAGRQWIDLNGDYTLSFRAKALAGQPVLHYAVFRQTSTTYLNSEVVPTVSATRGAGWNNYSFSFAANENGTQTGSGQVSISASGGIAIVADVSLVERPEAGNTTVLRNAVYRKLLAYRPGVLRLMDLPQWGCTVMDAIKPMPQRRLCGYSIYLKAASAGPEIGLNDLLQIANATGAEPWYSYSFASTPAEAAGLVEFLAGRCGNGNPYTEVRCDEGQQVPWTTVFAAKGQHIYLEDGNEVWNIGANQGASIANDYGTPTGGGTIYGNLDGEKNAAMKAAPDWPKLGTIVRVIDGWGAAGQQGMYGWESSVLNGAQAIKNGLPDLIDAASYVFSDMTQANSDAEVFLPMFAELVNKNTLPTGPLHLLQSYAKSKYGINAAIYEANLGTQYGLATTQSALNGYVAGVGAGLDAVLNQLTLLRDSGMVATNFFALSGDYNAYYTCASVAGGCKESRGVASPIWGSNLFMAGTGPHQSVDRPAGIAFQVANEAIASTGSQTNLLNLKQIGSPTYVQAAAQPDPNNQGANSIAANPAVPYIQSFGFASASGSYSLIVFNLNLTEPERITFSGPGAPAGMVKRTVFTSARITDNNESALIGGMPKVRTPVPAMMASPKRDILPPFSMTTYIYQLPPSKPAPRPGDAPVAQKITR